MPATFSLEHGIILDLAGDIAPDGRDLAPAIDKVGKDFDLILGFGCGIRLLWPIEQCN